MAAVRRLLIAVAAAFAVMAALAAPANAAGDDYPWRTASTNAADSWGFTQRQCVSFAAWRLAQARKPINNRTQRWGSALTWDDTARRLGKRVTTRPRVGAIAHWNAGERSAWYASGSRTANGTVRAGAYGHVGVVRYVYADGSVKIEQYNMFGTRSFSTMRVKAPRYLYV